MNPSFRALAVLSAAAATLAVAGCRNSPCSPPACMAEPPAPSACAPAPSNCAPPPCASPRLAATPAPAPRPVTAAPVAAAPAPDAAAQARLQAMRDSLAEKEKAIHDLEERTNRVEAQMSQGGAPVPGLAGKGRPEEAAQRLADELKGVPGAQVLVEGPSVVVILADSFQSGSDKLKTNPDLRAAIKATALAVARHPEAQVSVVGHSDGAPISKSNWTDNTALSRARAETVAKELAGESVPRERLRVDGVGPKDPIVAPEKTAADRARNRRVEIEFSFATKST